MYIYIFLLVHINNNKDKIKNSYIVIINLVMIITKGIGWKELMLLVILLWNLQKTLNQFFSKWSLLTLSNSNGCSAVIYRPILTTHISF